MRRWLRQFKWRVASDGWRGADGPWPCPSRAPLECRADYSSNVALATRHSSLATGSAEP